MDSIYYLFILEHMNVYSGFGRTGHYPLDGNGVRILYPFRQQPDPFERQPAGGTDGGTAVCPLSGSRGDLRHGKSRVCRIRSHGRPESASDRNVGSFLGKLYKKHGDGFRVVRRGFRTGIFRTDCFLPVEECARVVSRGTEQRRIFSAVVAGNGVFESSSDRHPIRICRFDLQELPDGKPNAGESDRSPGFVFSLWDTEYQLLPVL